VASKQVKAKKNGEPYLALILADRTGQIEAKMWDNVDEFILPPSSRTTSSRSRGSVNKYKNRFQLTIHKLRRMEEAEIDFTDYLPKTTKDIGELWRTLTEFVATFQNPHLKSLIELVHGGRGDC
jgi:3'-5' exoribonuclease